MRGGEGIEGRGRAEKENGGRGGCYFFRGRVDSGRGLKMGYVQFLYV